MSFSDFDRQMMTLALRMARRGWGATAPNPSVGAVIADETTGEVIARGVTQPGGRPHAEVEAFSRAGARARGATLYVTLEPCAHHGKTPPCAEAALAAGVSRVVIGVEDPDLRVAGQGISLLRDAGVRVDVGLMADEARWVTLGHILRVTEQRPFVQLKMALAADGTVPRGADGRAVFVTGPEARAQGHLLRAEADAILVGGATARDDDPELTCRLPGLAPRSPIRVVLSRTLDLSPRLKLVRTAGEMPVWVLTGDDADAERVRELEEAGVQVLQRPLVAGHVGMRDVLAALADAGVTRLLVEGGAGVWRAFAAERLVDEVVIFQAGLGAAEERDTAALADRYAPGLDLARVAARWAGPDLITVFRTATAARST
ncbi:MAG TPA: bifunctional diaminohydroxyphosphoribosylaminopyrimidine deaminase/5-amino-6-(5-phosphoribosylamino)uracil reductase RibD [Hyphomicrobium sp.]|nr:bifunctional diaminohydroxyphosphoribosylaminopyrimidine deaminase/5-amino-6-(5-phosphoribosylamino)uracil reductase RibD [Hyphomicrobium sp.]